MAMRIARDNLWLCSDCTIAAVNGDFTGFRSDEDVAATERGLERLGPHLVCDDGVNEDGEDGFEEFSRNSCDCCGDGHHGSRTRFAVLESVEPAVSAPVDECPDNCLT